MYHARVTSIHIYDQDKYKNQQVIINKEISENTEKSKLPSCRGIQDFMYLYRGEATYLDAGEVP